MKKRNALIIIIVSVILILGIAALKNYKDISASKRPTSDLATAESIIREHFKWWNEKNINKLNNTMTKDFHNINWDFENLEYVKLISIKEELSSNVKDGYMTNGKGKFLKPKDVKVFTVQYEIKLKDNNKGVLPSGEWPQRYIVIKQDENSSWLINEMGW